MALILRRRGIERVRPLAGGFRAWRDLGYPMTGLAAVAEAAKTLRGISGAHVVTMSAVVDGDHITEYRTTVDIAFGVERS